MTRSTGLLAQVLAVAAQQDVANRERNWRMVLERWQKAEAGEQAALLHELAALPPCFFDANRLGQVVDHLLRLAARSAPAGSVVRVRLAATADQAEFALEDEEPMVPEAEPAQWFASGQEENPALVRRIVESHYGTLTVANLPRQGRRFSFTIPVRI